MQFLVTRIRFILGTEIDHFLLNPRDALCFVGVALAGQLFVTRVSLRNRLLSRTNLSSIPVTF